MTDPTPAEQLNAALTASNVTAAAAHSAAGPDVWAGSPYRWIKEISSSRKRGAEGEKLVTLFLGSCKYTVTKPTSSDSDRNVNAVPTEIKFSTLWEKGTYRFQQLRDQDYHYVVCFGLSPQGWHMWIVPKQVAWDNSTPQHGGSGGTDTHWLEVDPENPPAWLAPYGGTAARTATALQSAFGTVEA